MADIFDLAPITEDVAIRGSTVQVGGVPLGDFVKILKRFPDLVEAFKGGAVEADRWFDIGADALGAVIAAGCGRLGDERAESAIARLPAMDQMALIEPIVRLTAPEGVGPFVARLMKLMGAAPSDPATPSSSG